jgi:hypothetical protein
MASLLMYKNCPEVFPAIVLYTFILKHTSFKIEAICNFVEIMLLTRSL